MKSLSDLASISVLSRGAGRGQEVYILRSNIGGLGRPEISWFVRHRGRPPLSGQIEKGP
jgi:hypothetical protein